MYREICDPRNYTDHKADTTSSDLHRSNESTYTATNIDPARDNFTTTSNMSLQVPVRGARGGAPVTKAVILV